MTGLSLTGPDAREVLARVCDSDVSNAAFPFLSIRPLTLGLAPVTALRISYTGELGYELYTAPQYQRHVHDRLWNRLLAIGSEDPDPAGGEPVLHAGLPVARLTSAAFGFTVGHSLGFAYLPAELDVNTADLEVEVLGNRLPARVLEHPPYDPSGTRLRS